MKFALVYLLAGIMQHDPMPDMPHCLVQMERLPFVPRALSSCRTKGIVIYWQEWKKMVEEPITAPVPSPADDSPVQVHDNLSDHQRNT